MCPVPRRMSNMLTNCSQVVGPSRTLCTCLSVGAIVCLCARLNTESLLSAVQHHPEKSPRTLRRAVRTAILNDLVSYAAPMGKTNVGDPGVHRDTKGDTLGSRVGFSLIFDGFWDPPGSRFLSVCCFLFRFGVTNLQCQF